ncbi:MAG TPA: hypothetical protein ENI17_09675 [Pseudomonas xinjiangensis]|uniref:NusG-like N-terminal domain-containing protein n=2 Tax=root TaxID=1 RepID=A0A7V1BR88_9GAMM|nr:hypothetical protein [Halopseudomonas xinjiangensis]HEC47884.1 hypothetical protein [Halopseudomonas xinjiangensis]
MNNQMELTDIAWYLIQCESRHNENAGEHLARQGFECFNPTASVGRFDSRKVKRQDQPVSRLHLHQNKNSKQSDRMHSPEAPTGSGHMRAHVACA